MERKKQVVLLQEDADNLRNHFSKLTEKKVELADKILEKDNIKNELNELANSLNSINTELMTKYNLDKNLTYNIDLENGEMNVSE